MIGVAEKVNKNLFSLPLLIDERCELMADHQTGQHIQGMILIEACRQTFIAVTEEFYMSDKVGQSYYVIMANEITKAILQTQYISTQAVEENVYA
ncbi:A-factor biosynthesis repeat protein [Photorhabdus khanii NC19]|uniref:A-factor biosynthesis repeat protein n=1 Tax=Photorhabdus khanii NC19 TaxID=1004151 RepID=W3VDH8_9GAMM|nr:A-factor biosynthesis repeat protein [Photorhabdus khanii NC19]